MFNPVRLPFYYGWVIVAVAFVTMGIGVTARTMFSLLLPPMLDEFDWGAGVIAGSFSLGFLVSAAISPFAGRMMDQYGPRLVVGCGVILSASGLLLSPAIEQPWHLYATIGVLVGAGTNLLSYTAQSLYLPNWFSKKRGLAMSVAFAGAGIGAITLLPWIQTIIGQDGWRAACITMGTLILVILAPINLILRRRPQDIGLLPDGSNHQTATGSPNVHSNIVDHAWASVEWTLSNAITTLRFWMIALGYFCGMFAWYGVQVHQTRYLINAGFSAITAAWALGLVVVIAIPGQILLGALSDRWGREWIWSVGCTGFGVCSALLIYMETHPSNLILYLMIFTQGFFGYALPSVMGPIVAEIFEGPHYGTIFGTISTGLIGGGAAGSWILGVIYDASGSYHNGFLLCILASLVSAIAIWVAGPRKVRVVSGA